jgi:hypothetical protein
MVSVHIPDGRAGGGKLAMMTTCRCTSLKHPEHLGRICEKIATESDGYCSTCHAHAQAKDDVKKLERGANLLRQ